MSLSWAKDTLVHFDSGKVKLTGCICPAVHACFLQLVKDLKLGRESEISLWDIGGECATVGLSDRACGRYTSAFCVDCLCLDWDCAGAGRFDNMLG
jgi:hypothetical protein